MKVKVCVGNSSVVKIYVIRPKPGPVAKDATPRPSGWESNPRPLDYQTSALQLSYRSRCQQLGRKFSIYTRNTCTQQPLAQGNDMIMQIFSFSRCTFQETVGSHLKPSLAVVVTATLCYGNNLIETFFVVSVNSSPLAKISQYISIHQYTYIHNVASTPS